MTVRLDMAYTWVSSIIADGSISSWTQPVEGHFCLAGKGFLVVQCPAGPENRCSRRTLLANRPWLECQCQPVGTNEDSGMSGAEHRRADMTWECSYCPDENYWKRPRITCLEWLVVKFYITCDNFFATDWCNYGRKQGRGLKYFLCPTVMTCWSFHFHICFTQLKIYHLSFFQEWVVV